MKTLRTVQTILVFSVHPDDAEFACGGALAEFGKRGKKVILCVITNGSKGTHWNRLSPKDIVPIRKREQRASAKTLGVKKVIFLGEEDGFLENTPKVRRALVKVIRRERPDIIISFDPASNSFDSFGRFHRDHRVGAEAVFDAVYPEAGCDAFYPGLEKQGYGPHTIKAMWFFASDSPNFWLNISSVKDKKIQALSRHKSQMANIGKMKKMVLRWASGQGRKKKMKYAEAFRVLTA